MKIILTIRAGNKPGHLTMRTDMKLESRDTPRITAFAAEIKTALDDIIKGCEGRGEVRV